ncbi:DUF429 domain-containing protein [Rhodobaculum claviforme]|uniref:DUF429 domain-containing protein n=1 Tax=Rhodobaculum claviforme TaxID=1549854 RepID=A0A934WJ91_9RHOB|nr:DUF429 domain-containing protein [Rhodobaculum claviforme]MBK5928935.1 hypothetical protein [Rhodobaculum claviforme]
MRVAGADGCRAGWLVVIADAGALSARLVATLDPVLAEAALEVLGVDTPIGLDTAPAPGGRAADRAARRALAAGAPPGLRAVGSRVFSAPTGAQLAAWRAGADHAGVNAVHPGGPKLSIQAFNILPKIDAADRLAARDPRVVEVHPELSFLALANETLAPKRLAAARARRAALLADAGVDVRALAAALGPARGRWQDDDLLDAAVACWSAGRIARGTARRYPCAEPGAAAAPRRGAILA